MENVSLVKGQKVDLTKGTGLAAVVLGLGWDVNQGNSGSFDLDAFAVLLRNGKYTRSEDVVFFGNKQAQGVLHYGDNLTGAGDGDDEQIEVTFGSVEDDVTEILLAVNIYQADSKRQNFGMVQNAFIRIVDKASGQELQRYDLSEDYSGFSGVVFGKLYRHQGEWKFQAEGLGKNGDVNQIAQSYL